jgi:CMP-N,N'-diacetyllegionaminic acid synthase
VRYKCYMLKLSDLIIYSSESLRTALQRMTQNRRGVLFVCDEDGHLVGVLSDGDVRRSLLDNTLLISPIYKVMNTDPISAPNVQEATELLHRMNIVAVPVVDNEGQICEIVVEDQDSVIVLSSEANGGGSDTVVETGVLAIIPARGGSKRIPKKNLANVAGKSLLAWTIQAAKNSKRVSHVLVSTDDMEIAEAARAMGIHVPWLRPEALSTDTTSTLDVLLHALNWAVQNLTPVPEFGVLLEPTAPLRRAEQIDEAISLLIDSDADCVAAVSELPHVFHPEEVLVAEHGSLQPFLRQRTMDSRQLRNEQSSVYVLNGLVYAFRIQSVLSGYGLFGRKTIPMISRWEDFLDIDTPEDLEFANFKIGRSLSRI